MKTIPLSQGKVALVDDADYQYLSQWKWSAEQVRQSGKFYAIRHVWKDKKNIRMHRLIMGEPRSVQIDHINGDGLDNRRCNLRTASHADNQRNRGKQRNNQAGFKGVHINKRVVVTRYVATLNLNGKCVHIGTFATPEEAARAYDLAAAKYHGEFACLNNV
jgi:hypothetical protein